MFNFFKRKKDKKKRGGRKERGQEVGVTAQRGDGQFATPESVVSGESTGEDQSEQRDITSGSEAPGVMGNDISKPISTLQGLPDIPFIEIDRVPDDRVNKLPTSEKVPKVPEAKSPETDKTEREMKINMNELSQLQSPYLVKRVSELENMEKPVITDFENSAECESGCEKYVICDEASPANETVEEKSVTANDDTSLAREGSVASCEEYSSVEGGPVETGRAEENMYRVTEGGGALSCGEVYDRLKSSSEGDLFSLKRGCEIVKSSDDQIEESGESSEGELSESEQSESDNVVKNDSGCWDQRESSLIVFKNETQASQVSSDSGITDRSREKKRVKWADIDGKRELTYAREGSVCSSEEEESDDEEPEKEKQDDEEDDSEDEEESEEEEEEEEEGNNLTKIILIDKTVKDNHPEPESSSSSEEDSEEEENEGITSFNEVNVEPAVQKSEDPKEDSEDESEEESSLEESGNEDELKDDKNPLKIDITEMQNRIADLQRDISLKTSNIDRLQVELDAACNESEMVRRRFKRLEADLDLYKETNKELTERINVSASQVVEKEVKSSKQLEEAERRIKELEAELAQVKSEISSLQTSYKKLEADRDMEVQIIQKALEKALTDQEETEAKYEKEFENLRTLNSSREVQMLEDFEWKLREVQKACKKKMQDLETVNDKKSSELAEKLAAAQADLEQISHLKLCEIELNQLKQTSSEQRKNLRLTNRKLEELQVSEKILQEEVHSLRASLDKEKNHVATLQALHREELIDKDRRAKLKLEVQVNQLTTEWEERLRRENFRVKTDTERSLREEKNAAVELVKKLKDQEISQLKQTWEKKSQDLKKEIENYKKKISEIEDSKRNDFDKIQTNADREIFDLRRKMDKLDMSYQEKIEKIQEQHEKELTAVREECDRRVQQSEANLQLQVGNSRTTIELVKQQLQNEAQLKLEHLEHEYQNKLQQQWERLNQEKEEALEKMEESHRQSLELLYSEMEKMKKQSKTDIEGKKKNQSPRMSSSQKKNSCSSDVSHSRNPISFANVIYIFFFLLFLYPFIGPTTTFLTVLSIIAYYFITYVFK
nr:paramyosin isoform X2 [Halyomorpha halys]